MTYIPKMRKVLLLWIQIGVISLVFGQQNDLYFRHLTVKDGLSCSWVKQILQDDKGYMWFATDDGLNRYDGVSIKNYKHTGGERPGLINNNITCLFEDTKKQLWIGTNKGLSLYDRKMDRFIPIENARYYIKKIYELKDGQLLIGSPEGLFLYNPKTDTSRQVNQTLAILDMLWDSKGHLWLATFQGLALMNLSDYNFKMVDTKIDGNKSGIDIIFSLYEDSNGTIWIGTNSDGLKYLQFQKSDPEQFKIGVYKPTPNNNGSISKGAIFTFIEDENKKLWIGLENGGINILDISKKPQVSAFFQKYTFDPNDPKGLSDNSIHYLYKDRHKTIWIGTHGQGINYINPILNKFQHIYRKSDDGRTPFDNRINTFLDEEDKLWIGTEDGLNVFDKRTKLYKEYKHKEFDPKSLGSNAVWSILRTKDQKVWIGLWEGGLNLMDESNGTFKRYSYSENDSTTIGSNSMFDLIETSRGELVIASMRGGLNFMDRNTGTFKRIIADYSGVTKSISSDWVQDLLEDSEGNIWISTSEAVDFFNRKQNTFVTYRNDPKNPGSISYNGANVIFEDSKKNIWIGTSNGLNLFNKKDSSFVKFTKEDGLPDNSIKAIEEDNFGNLWLSTNRGLSRFTPGKRAQFVNFSEEDGLQGKEFLSRSSFKNKDGLLFFGGNNGFNVFDPKTIKQNPAAPDVVLSSLSVMNKPVVPGDDTGILDAELNSIQKLVLKHQHSIFTIDFAALNFLAPAKNQYAYYLDGFEEDWNYVGAQRSATYTNLDPGTYTFRVKASNNDGVWNEEGLSLKIEVLPAWWASIPAKIFYLALIIFLIYYFRRHTLISINLKNTLWKEHLEKEKNEELNQLKSQFYADISHELRTPLTLILGPIDQLRKNLGPTENIDIIYSNAERLKVLVDQIMDFNKLENQMMRIQNSEIDVIHCVKESVSSFKILADLKGVDLNLYTSLDHCRVSIDEDKLLKILNNLLSNAIRHTAQEGKVNVNLLINKETSTMTLSVADTGSGIHADDLGKIFERFYTTKATTENAKGNGIGLNLTKKLVELMDGNIEVESVFGEGSVFTMNVPVQLLAKQKEMLQPVVVDTNAELFESDRTQKTILVIDDNQEIVHYIQSILQEKFQVVTTTEPLEYKKFVNEHLPDLIISDVMMPGIDGITLCSLLKSDIKYSHIPIILLTAKSGAEDRVIGFETDADDYIGKPFDAQVLIARIENLIRKKEKVRNEFVNAEGAIQNAALSNKLDIAFMQLVLDLIENNYNDAGFNVNHIIEAVNMSRSAFYKKFKSLSKHSINDLIKIKRLNKAAQLLNETQMNVSEISYACGFADPSYFTKVFRDQFNVAPKEYQLHFTSNKKI